MKYNKILFIGYSDFFRRRIYPSISKIKNLKIFVCSKSKKNVSTTLVKFSNYEEALSHNYNFVYISLVNSFHFKIAKLALEMNHNIIVDKPLVTKFREFKILSKIAKKRRLLLIEGTFFTLHQLFEKIKKENNNFKNLNDLEAVFNIPTKNKEKYKIKNLKKLNLDCLSDMSAYTVGLINFFFKEKIIFSKIIKNYYKKNRLIKSFKAILSFEKNKFFYGNFSFGKEYQSSITLRFEDKTITIPHQAFALPNKKIHYFIKSKNIIKKLYIKDNLIKNFFVVVLKLKYKESLLNNLENIYKQKRNLNLLDE